MQSKKTHIPLVARTANYSCSLSSRPTKKKAVSVQTDKCSCPFELWLESNDYTQDVPVLDSKSIETYSFALEYVNAIHSYMNKKLSERYDDCGDRSSRGKSLFKFPEVSNYATVFFSLLDKPPKQKPPEHEHTKKKDDKPILEIKKYTTRDSVIEFVPEIKQMAAFKLLEEGGVLEEVIMDENEVQTIMSHLREGDIQTIVTHLREDDSTICSSKTISDDFSSFCSKKSSNEHGTTSEEATGLVNALGAEDTSDVLLIDKKLCKDITRKTGDADSRPERSKEQHPETKPREVCDPATITKIIKQHIQEEFVSLLDKHKTKNEHHPKLVQSHFHVINIPPQINLLEYAQKKLERQLTDASQEAPQKRCISHPIATRTSMNIRPTTPKKVTNMFRKFSASNFRSLDAVVGNDLVERDCDNSDDDSVILDDEEFEKINGHLDERSDKAQNKNSSAYNFTMGRETSNPLKLTVRDMSKVNEKMLHTIGLFTERGDIRPGVIDILEQQKRAKAKDSRNKQFRVRRQWDLQVHLRPKEDLTTSFTASASTKSFISLSSTELKSDFETVKNISQQLDYDK